MVDVGAGVAVASGFGGTVGGSGVSVGGPVSGVAAGALASDVAAGVGSATSCPHASATTATTSTSTNRPAIFTLPDNRFIPTPVPMDILFDKARDDVVYIPGSV